jgi:hypothetical protein
MPAQNLKTVRRFSIVLEYRALGLRLSKKRNVGAER